MFNRLKRKILSHLPLKNPPNFLFVGAGKSGTTSLYHALKKHPEIFLPIVKETNYFVCEGTNLEDYHPRDQDWLSQAVFTWSEYLALYRQVTREKAIGEICPMYLYHPQAAEKIHRYLPTVKIVAVLRYPIEVVYSGYLMHCRNGLEDRPILQVLEDECLSSEFLFSDYVRKADYEVLLERYFKRFPRENIALYIFEEFFDQPIKYLNELSMFLNVSPASRYCTIERINCAPEPYELPLELCRELIDWCEKTTEFMSGVLGSKIDAWEQKNKQIRKKLL